METSHWRRGWWWRRHPYTCHARRRWYIHGWGRNTKWRRHTHSGGWRHTHTTRRAWGSRHVLLLGRSLLLRRSLLLLLIGVLLIGTLTPIKIRLLLPSWWLSTSNIVHLSLLVIGVQSENWLIEVILNCWLWEIILHFSCFLIGPYSEQLVYGSILDIIFILRLPITSFLFFHLPLEFIIFPLASLIFRPFLLLLCSRCQSSIHLRVHRLLQPSCLLLLPLDCPCICHWLIKLTLILHHSRISLPFFSFVLTHFGVVVCDVGYYGTGAETFEGLLEGKLGGLVHDRGVADWLALVLQQVVVEIQSPILNSLWCFLNILACLNLLQVIVILKSVPFLPIQLLLILLAFLDWPSHSGLEIKLRDVDIGVAVDVDVGVEEHAFG